MSNDVKLRQAAETRRLRDGKTERLFKRCRAYLSGNRLRGRGADVCLVGIFNHFMLTAGAEYVCIPVARFRMIPAHAAWSPPDHPLQTFSSLLWPALVGARALPDQRLAPCSVEYACSTHPRPSYLIPERFR